MAYRLRRDKSVQKSLRLVAVEQLDKAIDELQCPELDRHETVHQVRKRCKKIRGLIRLVRPEFADYKSENKFFRDAARTLSHVRDAQSRLECFDALQARFDDQLDFSPLAPLRDQLESRRGEIADNQIDLEQRLEKFLAQMREARQRAERWKIDRDGFPAIKGGLKKTYRRGRQAFAAAYRDPTTENFHQWRKRVKYHWYHARLLRRIWPDSMASHREAADGLSDLLGDDHDLAVLRHTLITSSCLFPTGFDLQPLIVLIDRRRSELRGAAQPLARCLFAERPSQLAGRWKTYWKAWTAPSL